MGDIFLSHVQENAVVALQTALALETAGYATWCYEIDSVPGSSYLLEIGEAVEKSQVVLLLVSSAALGSHQITREIERAHETRKPILPVLCDVTHEEFQRQASVWRQAVGTATSIHLPAEGIEALVPSVVRGLEKLGVRAIRSGDETRLALLRQKLAELEAKPQSSSAIVRSKTEAAEQSPLPNLTNGLRTRRTPLRKERLLLTLPFVVTALVLAPLVLIHKSVRIEGTFIVSQFSFVIGSDIPHHVFSGVATKAVTIHGMEKVDFNDGKLETVTTRDPQDGTPLTWQSVRDGRSLTLVPRGNYPASVTFPNAILNELTIPSSSHVTLLWLPGEPRLLRLRFDDKAIAGHIAVPLTLQFSCSQCRVTDGAGHEEIGEEWRFESDRGHVVFGTQVAQALGPVGAPACRAV